MAKKDRPAAGKAFKPRRSKEPRAGGESHSTDAPAKAAKAPPPPPPLNNHVSVHIIAVPPAKAGSPASIPLAPHAVAPPDGAAEVRADLPAPGGRAAAPAPVLRGPGSGSAPARPAPAEPGRAGSSLASGPVSAAGQRPVTPGAGSAALDPLAPTPVHKSAKNLSPMEQMLWAARLQKAKDVVASQMKVTVTGGKLVRRYTAIDHDDGLFEIETKKGFYVALLSKTGEFSIYWRHDRKAY